MESFQLNYSQQRQPAKIICNWAAAELNPTCLCNQSISQTRLPPNAIYMNRINELLDDIFRCACRLLVLVCLVGRVANAQGDIESIQQANASSQLLSAIPANVSAAPSLQELKRIGAAKSVYLSSQERVIDTAAPQANLTEFREKIAPALSRACSDCHGEDLQEGNIRVDTLDPDLLHGDDADWWVEVLAVLSKGEMPPADAAELPAEDRSRIVEWLTSEIQLASTLRRAEAGQSAFRRMTRYEYNYALQDLLGRAFDFAKDLPPEPTSEDGFQNSSEMLHMSVVQFGTYREAAYQALLRTTVRGEQPQPLHWGISMESASAISWQKLQEQFDRIRERHKDDPEKLAQELERQEARVRGRPNDTHYKNRTTGRMARATWSYGGAQYAWEPSLTRPAVPAVGDHVAIIPPRRTLIVELGDRVPDRGTLRVRIRAARVSTDEPHPPSLQLEFGWQASNDSAASVRISEVDLEIDALPEAPRFYQWDIPLSEIYPRNSVRNISQMGDLPSPSEFIKLVNSSISQGDIQIDYVDISAPIYESWPPASHHRIFIDSDNSADEIAYGREVLAKFMTRAWRRPVTEAELDQKMELFQQVRPACRDFQEAMTEVLAAVLSSPNFLYVSQSSLNTTSAAETPPAHDLRQTSDLATRLSMLLWASIPDDELLQTASAGLLDDPEQLVNQTRRMLANPRSRRFSQHFVRQWLGMQLLDYLDVDRKAYPQFDATLKAAMYEEPIAFFHELLQHNSSVLDLLHADYTMANERLAKHYGLEGVAGNQFRRVGLHQQHRRGGLLTQAGLLAMNSDGKDSHPLKRGIWLLESLLNDPPPPPPPAVPEIDLADPEIAKLTLKQRIEDHRNHAACMSCHAKIDPWGIAFENFDAVGGWRTDVEGKPIDATSVLFNGQPLDGMDGLKRYLLESRQDQFTRAMVHKMTTYAIGRPLTFADRASIDQIAAKLRQRGDGLATMIELIVTSDLFRHP